MDEQLIHSIVNQVLSTIQQSQTTSEGQIPIAISARHVHLSEQHVEVLFGKNYQLTPKVPLSQPGQFAAIEQVTIISPKSSIHHVRVLGPARSFSQVEISMTDARTLGIEAPLRHSGEIQNSAPITIVGPNGCIFLNEGCIIAASHIHMSFEDASRFHVKDGQLVSIRVNSERPIIFNNVKIRVSERFQLEMHIDTDEGNAAFIRSKAFGEIIQQHGTSSHKEPEQVIMPFISSKKLISEKDIRDFQHRELIIQKNTIVTALAYDEARKKGITIVRQ